MQHLRYSLGALLLLAAALVTANAVAQPKTPAPTPAGRWKFATTEMANRCTMSGEMQVWRVRALKPAAGAAPTYACNFTAFQTCRSGFVEKIETEQTCSVENKDGKLYFAAKVNKIREVRPVEILDTVKAMYAPDNFLVQLNARGDQMDGMFISVSEAPVKFVRLEELVS